MTLIVIVALAACFIAGVVLLYRARIRRRGAGLSCPRCAHVNSATAKFCAMCGDALQTR